MIRRRFPIWLFIIITIIFGGTGIGWYFFVNNRTEYEGKRNGDVLIEYNENAQYVIDAYEIACLRKDPYVNSEIIAYLPANEKVKILSGWGERFVYIESKDGQRGFLLSDFLSGLNPMILRSSKEKLRTEDDVIKYVISASSIPVYNGYNKEGVIKYVPICFLTNGTPVKTIKSISSVAMEIIALDTGIVGYVDPSRISDNQQMINQFRERVNINSTDGKMSVGSIVVTNALERVPVFSSPDKQTKVNKALLPGCWLKVLSIDKDFCYVADAFEQDGAIGYIEKELLYPNN